MREKILNEKILYKGKIVSIKEVEVELPNGKIGKREIVEHPGAVAILPVDDDKNIYFVRQFRLCANEILLEIPAGKLNYGEDPYSCAIRELEEEIGYRPRKLELIHIFYPSPGISSEILYFFIAENLEKTKVNPDEDEFLEIVKIKEESLESLIKENKIKDAKTLIGIYYYLKRRIGK
ncbi:MAG: NUDIX hydrolase [Dictyoglomaceae bacterium]